MATKLKVEDVGPVRKFEADLEPGITVIRGANGGGKSTILKSVSKAMGGDPEGLSARDGAKRGRCEIGGIKLSVSKAGRATKSGKLQVHSLEGKYDISHLVDPGVKDKVAADAKRIALLISMSNQTVDRYTFQKIVGSIVDEIDVDWDEADPIKLVGAVKRTIEAEARLIEKKLEKSEAEINTIEAPDVRPEDPIGDDEIMEILEAGIKRRSELAAQRKVSLAAKKRAEEARAMLASMDQVRDVETIESDIDKLEGDFTKLRVEKEDLERRLQLIGASLDENRSLLQMAKRHEADRKSFEEAIASDQEIVSEESIDEAEKEVQDARRMAQAAGVARQHICAWDKLEALKSKAKKLGEMASELRSCAAKTSEVLNHIFPECPIRIEGDRLVVASDRSQSEPFSELSPGERSAIGVEMLAKFLPEDGIGIIQQEVWESLQPSVRAHLNQLITDAGIPVITAEAADGELEAVKA